MPNPLSRRDLLAQAGLAAGAALALGSAQAPAQSRGNSGSAARPFRFCLNTSTVRGQGLPLPELVDIAAEAGYDAIEPWLNEIEAYVKSGGSLSDLRKRIADRGLTVDSAIGFAQWIVDDDEQRAKGLEQAKRDMDRVRQLGGLRIAAPPVGAHAKEHARADLLTAAERYRALLELGDAMEVVPQVEVWGFSQSLNRLGEVVLVAMESGHPKACVLPDIYHLHKGGSSFAGLNLLAPGAIGVFHMNDYPADIPREKITDADRVYPGDGDAPLGETLRGLRDCGFCGTLSLELFNREYWKQDARLVAQTGLRKMREVVERSVGG